MADCRTLQTASGYFVSTLSRHLAFENRRCLETPCGSDAWHAGPSRRVAALIAEAQASPLEAGDGRHVVRALPSLVATLPLPHPCPSSSPLSPFRFAAMASSAQSASQRANLCCISNVRDALDWSASGDLRGMLTATSSPVNAHRTTRGIAQCQTRS
jgi:hypothetical protein